MTRTKVAAIVGPTAVGKTEIAISLAPSLGAEIVSVDSMQIYRGMDIGTAKPTMEQRAKVGHHLLDLRSVAETVSVAEFQSLARAAIDDISAHGRLPLLAGGSGLYFRAVVDDLNFPPHAPEIRASLETEVEELGAESLHRRLAEVDPQAAAKIEPGNARRTVRALEVIKITGRPFSENATAWESYESRYDLAIAGLTRDRDDLFERISERVDAMLSAGLVDEVARLEHSLGPTARQALGYRQVLELPGASHDELASEIVRATKRFARRQEAWFRSDPRVRWFDATQPDVSAELLAFFDRSLSLRQAGNRT